MNRRFNETFDALLADPAAPSYPLQRHNNILATTTAGLNERQTNHVSFALRDAFFISFGAMRVGTRLDLPDPIETTSRSLSLLAIGGLNQGREMLFRQRTGVKLDPTSPTTFSLAIAPNKLAYQPNQDVFHFSPKTLELLRNQLRGIPKDRGCPARGPLLRAFFERYVTTVFTTTATAFNQPPITETHGPVAPDTFVLSDQQATYELAGQTSQ